MGFESGELDFAAGLIGVVGHEALELGLRVGYVEQAAGDALMQCADRHLIFVYGGAVGAVAQAQVQPIVVAQGHDRLEPGEPTGGAASPRRFRA